MDYRHSFSSFAPRIVIGTDHALVADATDTGLLVLGELHGVSQNADALYTFFTMIKASTLAIECPHAEAGSFIESLKSTADFSLIDPKVLMGSMLSVETAKAIHELYHQGILKDVAYLEDDDPGDHDIELILAKNLVSLPYGSVAVMGNWHTAAPDGFTGHTSALTIARRDRPVTYVEYEYGEGSYFNLPDGIGTFDGRDTGSYSLRKTSMHDYVFHVPHADPVSHE